MTQSSLPPRASKRWISMGLWRNAPRLNAGLSVYAYSTNSSRPRYAPMCGCQYSMAGEQMAVISASQRALSLA